MISWKEIHSDFTPELQKKWEDRGFSYEECKKITTRGLTPQEFSLADYLRWKSIDEEGNFNESFNIEKLRKEHNANDEWTKWKSINKDFTEWSRKKWEEKGFDWKETKGWIEIGFEIYEEQTVKEWKDYGFTSLQVSIWISAKLGKNEAKFATYLRGKNYNSFHQLTPNLEEWIEEYKIWKEETKSVQGYLDFIYPIEIRKKTTFLDIGEEKLEGSPNLKEFINLTEISCQKNQLSNLDFLLTLSNPEKLIYLDVSCNNFPPCDLIIFSRFKNLKTLVIDNSPFYGSLKPLENLHKLEFLYINDTDITEGLKYLPDRVEWLACEVKERLQSQVIKIAKKLEFYRNKDEYFFNPLLWKKDQLIRSLEEENIKIESLEDEIFHLTNLIKQQKKKIVQAYLRFNPEKELLRKLIEAHLQITKWRKKEAPLTEYETELTEYKKIRSDLKSKLNGELKEKIKTILSDCEELVVWELDLEDKLKEKSLLLEEKNKLPQITNNEQGNYLTNNMETEVDKQISFYQPREKNINRVDGLKEIVYKKTNQVQEEKEFERLFGEVRSKIKKIEKLRLKKNREKLSSKKEIEKNDVLQYLLNQKKSKKDQRNQIFTIIYQQLTNQDFEFWLKEFTELKKVLNSLKNKETNSGVEEWESFLQIIKESLQKQGANEEVVENFYQVQAEINGLRQKIEKHQSYIQIPPK